MSRSRRSRRPLPPGFGVIWTTVALDLVGFGILFPVLARYAEEFGASPTTAGALVASFSIAQLLCAPLWGRVSDRFGRKPVLIASLLGTAAGSLLTGLATGLFLLFLGRIIDGISGASVSVAQAAVTDIAPPEDRPRLLGLLGAAFGAGFALGPAIGGLTALVDHRLPFFVAAGIAAVNALAAVRRLPETYTPNAPRPDSKRVNGPDRAVDARRTDSTGLVRFIAVTFVSLVAFSGFEATFSLLTHDRFDLGESGTYGVFFVIGIAIVFVQAGLIHPVHARLGELLTIRAGLVSNAAGLALVAAAESWALLAPGLVLLVFGQGLLIPTLSSAVAGRARAERRATVLGFQQSAGGLARVVGPLTAGVLFQHAGVPVPYAGGAGLAVLALVLVPPAAPRAGVVDPAANSYGQVVTDR